MAEIAVSIQGSLNVQTLTKGRTRTTHLVESVSFPRDTPPDRCPIECTCGWIGQVREWPQHGKGLRVSWGRRAHEMPDVGLPWLALKRRSSEGAML